MSVIRVVTDWGYWCVLAEFLAFAYFVGAYFRRFGSGALSALREHRIFILFLILPVVVFMFLHEPVMFRVQNDEFSISSIAQCMHYERVSSYATRAHDLFGSFQPMDLMVNKRPLFFPFLISCVHDLTGYRPENVFVVNAVLCFLFYISIYFIGVKLSGSRLGCLGVLLFAGLPLLSQNVTCGGFDVCALSFLALLTLLCILHEKAPDNRHIPMLVMVAVFLGQTRYECSVYAAVAYLLVLGKAWRQKDCSMSLPFAISPILFSIPILSFRLIKDMPDMMQTDPDGVWGTRFLFKNINSAVYFLFGDGMPNSLLLSTVGLGALVMLVVFAYRHHQKFISDGGGVVLGFSACSLGMTILLLFYFWGGWDDPMVSRLSLPFHMALVFAILLIVRELRLKDWAWLCIVVPILVVSICTSVSCRTRDESTGRMLSAGYHTNVIRELRRLTVGSKPLVVSDAPVGTILYGFPSVSTDRVLLNPERVAWLFKTKYYQDIFVVERFHVTPDGSIYMQTGDNYMGTDQAAREVRTKSLRDLRAGRLEKYFEFKVVSSFRISSMVQARISKIVGLRTNVEFKSMDVKISEDGTYKDIIKKYIEIMP